VANSSVCWSGIVGGVLLQADKINIPKSPNRAAGELRKAFPGDVIEPGTSLPVERKKETVNMVPLQSGVVFLQIDVNSVSILLDVVMLRIFYIDRIAENPTPTTS